MRFGSVIFSLLVGGKLLWTPAGLMAQTAQDWSHGASCRDSRVSASRWQREGGTARLRLEVDVDGDGLVDVLEAERSYGSGFSSTDVHLTLGGSGTQLRAEEGFAFTAITAINPVSKELLDPCHRAALVWIEEALFPRICTAPDPSLAWLLAPTKRLSWIAGAPEIPGPYAIRIPAKRAAGLLDAAYVGEKIDPKGEVWLFYAGGVHAHREMVELARMGGRVLLGTAHGVILTNSQQSRHAWIYVYPGDGDVRLRSASIAGARIQGDMAIITLKGWRRPSQVRINLKTGAISTLHEPSQKGTTRSSLVFGGREAPSP